MQSIERFAQAAFFSQIFCPHPKGLRGRPTSQATRNQLKQSKGLVNPETHQGSLSLRPVTLRFLRRLVAAVLATARSSAFLSLTLWSRSVASVKSFGSTNQPNQVPNCSYCASCCSKLDPPVFYALVKNGSIRKELKHDKPR